MPKLTCFSQTSGEFVEVSFAGGSELIEIARKNPDLPLVFGCRQGNCGVCAVEILEGQSHIAKMGKEEKATLERKGLPKNCRLACQCALNGNVCIRSTAHVK